MENERFLCPCKKCKHQKRRLSHVLEAHVEKWGMFELSRAQMGAIMRGEVAEEEVSNLNLNPDLCVGTRSDRIANRLIMNKRARFSLEGTEPIAPPLDSVDNDHVDNNLLSDNVVDEMIDALIPNIDDDIAVRHNQETSHSNRSFNLGIETDYETIKLKEVLKEPLYKGAKVGKLRALLGVMNIQTAFGWSNTSVDALLTLLSKILPNGNVMPKSHGESKKILSSFGLDYECIHACPRDCILFRGEYEHLMECPKCGNPRFRTDMLSAKVPCKVLRHSPLFPRLRHMYRCKEIASLMSWWYENRSRDDIMRGPYDSDAWKHIESCYPDFAKESRNLHFGLSTDGVNPFGIKSTNWSTWPVVLVNYNIPPWLATKKGHIILSLLIPGKHKVKNMNVYLQPLLDELKTLWEEGLPIIDASKGHASAKYFQCRGILLWTMHDYPGLGDCASFSVSGYSACPMHCGPNLAKPRYSHALHKMVYEGHNLYRSRNEQVIRTTAQDWRIEWEKCANEGLVPPVGMKALSSFYQLPYWESLLICHLLDPMHIFKNVASSLWDHIMGRKDDLKWRMDFEALNKRQDLWVNTIDSIPLKRAPWVLSKEDKCIVRKVIREFKMPTGSMHSLKGAFTSRDELVGLKSHDWHKMLAFILPIAIRQCDSISEDVKKCVYGLGELTRWISSKEIHRSSIQEYKQKSLELLCRIEAAFPASFMDIQTHLLLHLADEVQAAGTVHSRWMFYLERFMKTLKGFVRQKARPEGSMAEGWLVHETCVYVTEFMRRMRGFNDHDTPLLWSINEDKRLIGNVPQGKGTRKKMNETMRKNILNFCYSNSKVLEPWRRKYDEERIVIKTAYSQWKKKNRGKRNTKCPLELEVPPMAMTQQWLKTKLDTAQIEGTPVSEELWEYARGPDWFYKSFNALWSHGKHFRVSSSDHGRLTFDSGVSAEFLQHATDLEEGTEYYPYCGTINDIMEVNFRSFVLPLFDVKWYIVKPQGPRATVKWDRNGFYAIDTSKVWPNKNDTLVLPELCDQVVFQPMHASSSWHYVIEIAPRSVRTFHQLENEIDSFAINPMQGSPQADITLKGSLEAPSSPEYMDEIPRDVDLQVDELLEADIGPQADVVGEACFELFVDINCFELSENERDT